MYFVLLILLSLAIFGCPCNGLANCPGSIPPPPSPSSPLLTAGNGSCDFPSLSMIYDQKVHSPCQLFVEPGSVIPPSQQALVQRRQFILRLKFHYKPVCQCGDYAKWVNIIKQTWRLTPHVLGVRFTRIVISHHVLKPVSDDVSQPSGVKTIWTSQVSFWLWGWFCRIMWVLAVETNSSLPPSIHPFIHRLQLIVLRVTKGAGTDSSWR